MMEHSVVVYSIGRGGHSWTAALLRSWLPHYTIRTLESVFPSEYDFHIRQQCNKFYDPTWTVVVLVRDYLNWAASSFRHRLNYGETYIPISIMDRADIWYNIVLEAINVTNYIPHKVPVNYDRLTGSRRYREEVCHLLDGKYSEQHLNYVPTEGDGSSFDKCNYQGRGSEMTVRDRWKWFLSEEGEPFQSYLRTRPEILEFYLDNWEVSDKKRRFCESMIAAT